MAQQWFAFAPLLHAFHPAPDIELPHSLGHGVSFSKLPSWVFTSEAVDALRSDILGQVHDGAEYCLAVEYAADSLAQKVAANWGEPDLDIHSLASARIHYACLALWLTSPTIFTFKLIAYASLHDGMWVTRLLQHYEPLLVPPGFMNKPFSRSHFVRAEKLSHLLQSELPLTTLRMAASTTMLALRVADWRLRFVALWLVGECLFGSEKANEIAFRLSQRMAFFLESDGEKARDVFIRISELYRWRSKAVHGRSLKNFLDDRAPELMTEMEQIVRRALVKILEDEKLAQIFEGREREDFLDRLAFR